MPDRTIREANANQPVPTFDNPAFNRLKKPLRDCRVALVTTAALRVPEQEKWTSGDQSFRILPASTNELILGHISPNFDRSGFVSDPNVVFPIDRLREMEAERLIGSVAARHIAFLGAQDETMTTIRLDSGPAAARVLLDDAVDVVLLTPV